MSEQDKFDQEAALLVWVDSPTDKTRYRVAARLRADAKYAINYTGFESRPCPFCTWDNGKHLADCGFHRKIRADGQEIERLREQLAALHGKVMNLEPVLTSAVTPMYIVGYSDARHAAACVVSSAIKTPNS